jgi:hypothetical protein
MRVQSGAFDWTALRTKLHSDSVAVSFCIASPSFCFLPCLAQFNELNGLNHSLKIMEKKSWIRPW